MANTKRVAKKPVDSSHPSFAPFNSSPLANSSFAADPNNFQPSVRSPTNSTDIDEAPHKTTADMTAVEGSYDRPELESNKKPGDDPETHEEVLSAPNTEPLSPKSIPLPASTNPSPSQLTSIETQQPINESSPIVKQGMTVSATGGNPNEPLRTASAPPTRSSKRLSQSTNPSTPPPKKLKPQETPSSTASAPTTHQYIFACVSCERLIRAHSTASLAPDVLWSKDLFIPVWCDTCANAAQEIPTPWAPETTGLRMRLNHHILRNWEMHRVADKAFGLALSDNEGARPVWMAERAWAILRAGEEAVGGFAALTAESIVIDRSHGDKWGGAARRYKLLKGVQKGFLTPSDTDAVLALVQTDKEKSGPGKWIGVPDGK